MVTVPIVLSLALIVTWKISSGTSSFTKFAVRSVFSVIANLYAASVLTSSSVPVFVQFTKRNPSFASALTVTSVPAS